MSIWYVDSTGQEWVRHLGSVARGQVVTRCRVSFATRTAVRVQLADDEAHSVPPCRACRVLAASEIVPASTAPAVKPSPRVPTTRGRIRSVLGLDDPQRRVEFLLACVIVVAVAYLAVTR